MVKSTQSDDKESILIVEDDEGIAYLQCRVLERAGYRAKSVATEKAALDYLAQQRVDLVILDYRLPGPRTGLHLYASMKEAGHTVPVIVVTGFSDEMTVIRALRAGVRDFVSKSNDYLTYIPEAVDRVLTQSRLEKRLEDAEARFRSFLDNVPAVTFIKDKDGHIVYANKRFESLFPDVAWQGKTERELFGDSSDLATDSPVAIADRLLKLVAPNGNCGRWSTHSFPVEGTLGMTMCGVVAFDAGSA
jgi:FixJ family two-component response regulator